MIKPSTILTFPPVTKHLFHLFPLPLRLTQPSMRPFEMHYVCLWRDLFCSRRRKKNIHFLFSWSEREKASQELSVKTNRCWHPPPLRLKCHRSKPFAFREYLFSLSLSRCFCEGERYFSLFAATQGTKKERSPHTRLKRASCVSTRGEIGK